MSEDKCPCETGALVWGKEETVTASAASGAVAAGKVTIGYVFRVNANWEMSADCREAAVGELLRRRFFS